jgi:hypothetical protein
MYGKRTRAWWLVRLELTVGIGMTLLGVWLGVERAMTSVCGFCNPPVRPLPLPPIVMVALAAFAIAVAGLAWMVRIIRGPRDEPPLWRYRD